MTVALPCRRLALSLSMAMPTLAYAAWNEPTRTMTVKHNLAVDGGGLPQAGPTVLTYSNWQWVGPDGKTYQFAGASTARIEYNTFTHALGYVDGKDLPEFRPELLMIAKLGKGCLGTTELTGVQASDGSPVFLSTVNGDTGFITQQHAIQPKYKILSIIYAPPGNGSSVTYGKGSEIGSSTTIGKSFAQSCKFTVGIGKKDVWGASLQSGWSCQEDSSNSIAITSSDSTASNWRSSVDGINHDQDVVQIWLNPKVMLGVTGIDQATWTLGNDPLDPATAQIGANVVYLSVAQLLGKEPITNEYTLAKLKRQWSPTGALTGPGTDTDFFRIAQENPYYALGGDHKANAFVPDPARFSKAKCPVINYAPANATAGFLAYNASSQTEAVDKVEYTKSYAVTASGGASFGGLLNLGAKGTWVWSDFTRKTSSKAATTSAELAIAQPPGNWTGPTDVVAYRDNVYGTFLFTYLSTTGTASAPGDCNIQ